MLTIPSVGSRKKVISMNDISSIVSFFGIDQVGHRPPAPQAETQQLPEEVSSGGMEQDVMIMANGYQSSLPLSLDDANLLDVPAVEGLTEAINPIVQDASDSRVSGSDTRSVSETRQGAEAVWAGHRDWRDLTVMEVLSDYRKVNGQVDANLQAAAQAEIVANGKFETQALSQLAPSDQDAYRGLADSMTTDGPARLAFQVLLLEDKLLGGVTAADGKDLLTQLSALQHAPLAPKIDRASLISSLVQEIAQPASIDQGPRSTCQGTSFQMQMALQQPAELVRQIAGLASPAGEVQMPDGQPLKRVKGTEADDESGRSISVRLWSPAVLDYGVGQFDNRYDYTGLDFSSALKDFTKAMGTKIMSVVGNDDNMRYETDPEFNLETRQKIQTLIEAGQPFRAIIQLRNSRGEMEDHAVTVIGMDEKGVTFLNPWGSKNHMSLQAFELYSFGPPYMIPLDSLAKLDTSKSGAKSLSGHKAR